MNHSNCNENYYIPVFPDNFFGCSNNETSSDNQQSATSNQPSYSIKPLVIDPDKVGSEAGMRISIVGMEETDTTTIYTAVSTYEGKELGLSVVIPKGKEGAEGFGNGIVLKTIGAQSDNLLSTLARLYNQPTDTTLQFTSSTSVSYVNLQKFGESLTGDKGGEFKAINGYKLFFEGEGENDYAELYLNVNAQENWVELKEKDEEYRPMLIKSLRK